MVRKKEPFFFDPTGNPDLLTFYTTEKMEKSNLLCTLVFFLLAVIDILMFVIYAMLLKLRQFRQNGYEALMESPELEQ